MRAKPIEELTFPTLFDGLYLGALWSGLLLIAITLSSLIAFLIFRQDWLTNYLLAGIFLCNIAFVTFLKHNDFISYSVWKEITEPQKKVKK